MSSDFEIIQLVIQAGAVGIALYLIYSGHKKDQLQEEKDKRLMAYITKQEENFSEVVKNHLNHNTSALEELSQIMKEVKILLMKNNRGPKT